MSKTCSFEHPNCDVVFRIFVLPLMVLYYHLGCSFQNIFSSCFSYSEASVLENFRIRAKGYCVAEAIVESLE